MRSLFIVRVEICQIYFAHARASFILENVEHCGGEPEQADTGIPLYAVP